MMLKKISTPDRLIIGEGAMDCSSATEQLALSAVEISTLLETWLEVEFTFYKVAELAEQYASCTRSEQEYVLSWIRCVATINVGVAWQFAHRAATVHTRMNTRVFAAWASHVMDAYDRAGLRAAFKTIDEVERFAQSSSDKTAGAVLNDFAMVLMNFVHGLSGRQLKLVEGDGSYTDSETLFLPAVIATMATIEDNFALAKAQVAMLWAQTRFGTFRCDLETAASQFADTQQALRCLHALETIRLEQCIARELPGLYRDMLRLRNLLGQERDSTWREFIRQLGTVDAGIETSIALLPYAYQLGTPPCTCYAGEFRPLAVRQAVEKRKSREKMVLRVKLRQMLDEMVTQGKAITLEATSFQANVTDRRDGINMELFLDGKPIAPPDDVTQLITSIVLDFGEIPPEYLFPAGDGEYDPHTLTDINKNPDAVWEGSYHEEGAFLYPEWDYTRQHYRKNWAVVREKSVTPITDTFVTDTLARYAGLVKHLRRVFEAMRDDNRVLKRQTYGEEVDIDAVVEALAESRDGREMTDRLFTSTHRTERSIAVMFMVDISGSTRGWINDAEREALILLCEALEMLGDSYAIYGFSSLTRKRCEIFRVKTFMEPYSAEVKGRIAGIRPQEYTRMGFAIRHLSKLLLAAEAKRHLLITISDGKPDDYFDGYRGPYGIEDTRKALQESMRMGIHPFCITIDRTAHEYLPHLYGAAQYVVIDDVKQLPRKVTDIYKRLTMR